MKKKRLLRLGKLLNCQKKAVRIMKLNFLFLVLFGLNLSANVYSQQSKVSLSLENVTIEEIIETVKQQTGVNFLYNSALFQNANKVSVSVRKERLDIVLQSVLEQQGFVFDFENDVVVIRKSSDLPAAPQKKDKRTVKGVVKDKDGATLPGVSVLIKGTQTGVATDINGNFELKLEDDPNITLQFSFVGMKPKEAKIEQSTHLNIVLDSDAQSLDEVVVTGYQTISRERATGAFDIINTDQLSRPASDLATRLIGTTAGVQNKLDSEGNLVFEIRGQTSLNADNARPLIVVDGFPVEGEFSSINPNDVESVTILKDAAAASIWGARSANGVIVVTTKRGQKLVKGGVNISVSAFVKVAPKLDLDYYNPVASSAEVIDYEMKGFASSFFGGPWSPIDDSYTNTLKGYSKAVLAMNENRLGFVSNADMAATLAKLRTQDNRDQIREYLLQNPVTHQYNVNISGATERMSNLLSLMYESDRDGFKENKKDKIMVNYRTNLNLFHWLDFNFSGMFQYNNIKYSGINASGLSRYDLSGAACGSVDGMSPYDMLVNPDGTLGDISYMVYKPLLDRHVPTEAFPYSDWSFNPIQEIQNRDLGRKELNTRVQAGFTVKLLQGLTFDTKIQYEMYNTNYTDIFNENTFYVRKTVNIASTWDNASGKVTPNLPKGGFKDMSKVETNAYNFRNQLSFTRSFADKHDVNVIAGMEVSDRVRKETVYPRTYGYNDESLSVGLFPNGPTGTKNWMGSNQTFAYTNSYKYNTDRYFSMYGNLAYTFDQKYTVSGSVRTDASNLITDDPKYRYSPFWSVGASWQIGKENFLKDYNWIDRLNVRATYGYNGNVDKSTSFRPLINVSATQNNYTHEVTSTIGSFGNPSLRWEKTGTWDIGVDYSFLSGKLYGKIDVYSKDSRDLITDMTIPAVNGTKSQKLNAAEMSNRGIEMEVGTKLPILAGDIIWSGNLNFSYNKNRIQKLYKATYSAADMYYSGQTKAYMQGYDANTMWVFQYGGVVNKGTENDPNWQPVVKGANGDVYDFTAWAPGDGRDYMVNAGTKVAPYTLGFSNAFKIYDFNLSFIITGKFGHKFQGNSFNYPNMSGGMALPNQRYSEVLNSDPSKVVPIPFGKEEPQYYFWDRFYQYMDYVVQNASHVRLQEVNISYNMPARWLNKVGIASLQVYAQGNNLCKIVNNKYKEDPEYPLGTAKPQATYTFGLKFDF